VHIAIVAAGVGALVSRSHVAFEVIRYVGAAYLVYLGVRQFRTHASVGSVARQEREPAWSMLRRGLFVNLTNPKAIVFFLAFLPQFVRPGRPLVPQYAVIAATAVAVDILVMWLFFATAARGLARLTTRESGRRTVNRVFGSLFVGVGVLLAAVH
jgi:homoserine/homoserine lactone efflux protein